MKCLLQNGQSLIADADHNCYELVQGEGPAGAGGGGGW